MEHLEVRNIFVSWLVAARQLSRTQVAQEMAQMAESAKQVAESAGSATVGVTRLTNDTAELHSKLETEVGTAIALAAATAAASSGLNDELTSGIKDELTSLRVAKEQMRLELQAAVDALQEQHGKEINDLRTDALDRTQLDTAQTSQVDEQLQSVLMNMQNLKEDSLAIERRLTEEFVSVQVTCDRLTRVVTDDAVKRELDVEVEARKQDVDMCNEAILALSEMMAPPEVLRPPGAGGGGADEQPQPQSSTDGMVRATARADDGDSSLWRAGVAEDLSMLESRLRQELISVQVRCDRLAR